MSPDGSKTCTRRSFLRKSIAGGAAAAGFTIIKPELLRGAGNSNVGLTMNVYVKSVSESQVNAMDVLSEKLGTCTNLATKAPKRIQ